VAIAANTLTGIICPAGQANPTLLCH
jgi:hypothetical protein